MSEKRRDSKNRILRSGESQRKDGRYAYKYTDTFGKVQFVYAYLEWGYSTRATLHDPYSNPTESL